MPGVIDTLDLFPLLDQQLIKLLRSLSKEDWDKKTISPHWTVKDVAAHLLDGNIKAISMYRDHHIPGKPPGVKTYQDIVNYLNAFNEDWIRAMKRVSPALITDLLEITGSDFYNLLSSLDPYEKSLFSVAWAGEEESLNWFHIAREYTEKWHHQQQIRLAVGRDELLYSRELYYPYLETSMRALPYHYRSVEAPDGTAITFNVDVEGGAEWVLLKNKENWELLTELNTLPDCSVTIPKELAWRIFSKEVFRDEVLHRITVNGKKEWGEHILNVVAVMA